jgi:Asp-tRNA(Asn)/Glu-tRNA(Gln) amidotransferase A subunit family amidase
MPDPYRLTATQAAERIRSGDLSAEALARSCLDRAAARDPDVRAWAFLDPEAVLAQARALDATPPKGPLHGVPIGVKDVILTRDMPTQYNSPFHKGSHPEVDAACVSLLRSAGAVVFGKTDTVEFAATGRKAATRNPHDLARTPGASSSGSAAAVADFHVPIALGTQTAGSMIRPASYCGVWALKPTWGLVSNEGAKRFAATLDTLGWFARGAADLGLMLDVFDPEPAETVEPFDVRGARIAVCRTPAWDQAEPATRDALAAGAERLAATGAEVVDLTLPPLFDDAPATAMRIMAAEGRATFFPEYRADRELLEEALRGMAENTAGISRADLVAAYDLAGRCREAFAQVAAPYDAVLTPSATGEAPVGLGFTGSPVFNAMWTLLHAPCVNVPGFVGPNGLPVGLTVTGPRFSDREVLAAAEAFGAVFAAGGLLH